LKNTKQVVLFREENPICPFTKYKLTEMASYREDLSETQIMDLEGYFRVYDAGKKTWIKRPTLNRL
jgi:hypothetical protein